MSASVVGQGVKVWRRKLKKKKLILISVEMKSVMERNVPATSEIRCPLKFIIIIILRTLNIGEDGTDWVGHVNNACCSQIN